MKSHHFLLFAVAVGAGLSGCVDRKAQADSKKSELLAKDPTVEVAVQPAAIRDMKDVLDVTGNITTTEDTQIGAKQAGKIVAVYVKDGDSVTAGEVLAEQDTAQLSAQLEQAMAQLQNARSGLAQAISNAKFGPIKSSAAVQQAQSALQSAQATLDKSLAGARPEERRQAEATLASAKVSLDTAEKDYRRKQSLADQGAIAKNELDQAQNAYAAAQQQYQNALQALLIIKNGNRPEDIAVARQAVQQAKDQLRSARASKSLDSLLGEAVNGARAQVLAAEAAVNVARANLSDATIKAPFAGKVAGKPIQAGTVVSPGVTVVHLVGSGGAYFDGQVAQGAINKVKIGAPVAIHVEGLSGVTIPGHVLAVNPIGTDFGRLFSLRIEVDGDLNMLKPNMFATGELVFREVKDAIVIPSDAIVTDGGKTYVFTTDGDKAKRLEVTTGLSTENTIQIIGVAPQTPIVVKGQQGLTDGAVIKVAPAPSANSGTSG